MHIFTGRLRNGLQFLSDRQVRTDQKPQGLGNPRPDPERKQAYQTKENNKYRIYGHGRAYGQL